MHRRWSWLLSLMAAGSLLSGCTGTVSDLPPLLLVVALVEANAPQIALVEDSFLTAGATQQRLRFLETSRRALPEPAVDFDVVDRAGVRNELVVLSRSDTAPYPSFLDFFGLVGIDPDDPADFAASRQQIDLAALIGGAELCPDEVGVDREGEVAVIFSDATHCSGADSRAIYVIDLEDLSVISAIDTEPLLEAGIHLDQELNRVLFLVDKIGSTELKAIELPDEGTRRLSDEIEGTDAVDLGPAGGQLLVLSDDSFQSVDLSTSPATLADPEQTSAGATTLARSPGNLVSEVVILTGSDLIVHPSLGSETERVSCDSSAEDAVIAPAPRDFAYLLESGGVQIFDLLTFPSETDCDQLFRFFSVPELSSPGPVTWAQGLFTGPQTP